MKLENVGTKNVWNFAYDLYLSFELKDLEKSVMCEVKY